MVVKFNKKIKVNKKSAVKAIRGIPTDFSLPSSYPNLLLWQTADEGVTTADALTQAITAAALTNVSLTGGKTDPFAGVDGYEILENSDTNLHHNITFTWGGATRQAPDQEYEVYVKRGTSGTRHAYMGHSTSHGIKIDLDTGVITAYGTYAPGIYAQSDSAGGGWWRVRGRTNVGSTTNLIIGVTTTSTGSPATYNGDGTSSIIVYSPQYGKQKQVTSWTPKAGTATASTQGTISSKPFLVECPTLGMRKIVGSDSAAKLLTDDPAIASALAGSDQAFTLTFLGRSAASVACDILKLTGSTAQHTILAQNTSHGFGISRTDDSASAATPTFAPNDFSLDRNWHVYSIVFNGTQVELYIDGQKSFTTFSVNVGTCTFTAIASQFAGFYVRERAIYSRALNNTERNAIESGMLSRGGLPTPSLENPLNIPGVQAWWETDSGVTLSSSSIPQDISAYTLTNVTVSTPEPGVYRISEANDATNISHLAAGNIVNAATGTLTLSIEAKRAPGGGRSWLALMFNTSTVQGYYDLDNGVVGSFTSGSGTITPLEMAADGYRWYRCTLEGTYVSAIVRIYTTTANNSPTFPNGDGRASLDVRNITATQDRVAGWIDKTVTKHAFAQGTASSQPFYYSNNYLPEYRINGFPTIGENTNTAAEPLNCPVISSVFNGADVPISMVGLFEKIATPAGTTNIIQLTGSPATHQLLRVNTTGVIESRRVDNTTATVNTNQGSAGNNGILTISQVFTGTEEGIYLHGKPINELVASQNITLWNFTNASAVANGDGSYRFKEETTSNASHFCTTSGNGFIGGSKVTMSVEMKKVSGGRTWAALQLGAGFAAYINLDTGAIGTQVSCTCTSESLGDGWYRFTCVGTPASIGLGLYSAEADNDVNYIATPGQSNFDVKNITTKQDVALDVGECTFSSNLIYQPRAFATRGFILANRALTEVERLALENGFKKRANIISTIESALATLLSTTPAILLWGGNVVVDNTNIEAGNQVQTWNDISGNSYSFTQATQAAQPTSFGYYMIHDPTQTNGEWLRAPAGANTALFTGKEAVTVASLHRRTARTSASYAWRADQDFAHYYTSTSSEQTRLYFNGTGNHAQVSPGSLFNRWANWIYRFNRSAATDAERLKININGTETTPVVTGSFDAAIASVSYLDVGYGAPAGTGHHGDHALFAVWGRTLSDVETATVAEALRLLRELL